MGYEEEDLKFESVFEGHESGEEETGQMNLEAFQNQCAQLKRNFEELKKYYYRLLELKKHFSKYCIVEINSLLKIFDKQKLDALKKEFDKKFKEFESESFDHASKTDELTKLKEELQKFEDDLESKKEQTDFTKAINKIFCHRIVSMPISVETYIKTIFPSAAKLLEIAPSLQEEDNKKYRISESSVTEKLQSKYQKLIDDQVTCVCTIHEQSKGTIYHKPCKDMIDKKDILTPNFYIMVINNILTKAISKLLDNLLHHDVKFAISIMHNSREIQQTILNICDSIQSRKKSKQIKVHEALIDFFQEIGIKQNSKLEDEETSRKVMKSILEKLTEIQQDKSLYSQPQAQTNSRSSTIW